eukprot:5694537-Amphidinium_carterae.2
MSRVVPQELHHAEVTQNGMSVWACVLTAALAPTGIGARRQLWPRIASSCCAAVLIVILYPLDLSAQAPDVDNCFVRVANSRKVGLLGQVEHADDTTTVQCRGSLTKGHNLWASTLWVRSSAHLSIRRHAEGRPIGFQSEYDVVDSGQRLSMWWDSKSSATFCLLRILTVVAYRRLLARE